MKNREYVMCVAERNGKSTLGFFDIRPDCGNHGRALSRDGEREDVLEEASGCDCQTINKRVAPREPDPLVGGRREGEEPNDIGSLRGCLENDSWVAADGIIVLSEDKAGW